MLRLSARCRCVVTVLTGLLLIAVGPPNTQAQTTGPDSLDSFLARAVVPLRSLSAGDDDFSDLEPLAEAIGTARIVQLGEQSHGAGAAFEARVRLIKFLHQRMGFDVVVWESGMYEMRDVNAALRAGTDVSVAAERGIFPVWSWSEEIRPLFEYARATLQTARPLEMAGFDYQISAPEADERFRDGLLAFVGAVPDPSVRATAVRLATQVLAGHQRLNELANTRRDTSRAMLDAGISRDSLPAALERWTRENEARLAATPAELDRFTTAADSLLGLIDSERRNFLVAHAPREIGFHEHALQNLRERGRTRYELRIPGVTAETVEGRNLRWNRRDTQNARNLLWLAREYYAGRKIIVWAHTGHVMNAYYTANGFGLAHSMPPGGTVTTGAILADSIPDQLYTIGIIAYQGIDGWATTGTHRELPPAPDGTLEERLHRTGHDYLFLDLKQLRGRPERTVLEGMRIRLSSLLRPEEISDWTRVVDAVLYLDTSRPATPRER